MYIRQLGSAEGNSAFGRSPNSSGGFGEGFGSGGMLNLDFYSSITDSLSVYSILDGFRLELRSTKTHYQSIQGVSVARSVDGEIKGERGTHLLLARLDLKF